MIMYNFVMNSSHKSEFQRWILLANDSSNEMNEIMLR